MIDTRLDQVHAEMRAELSKLSGQADSAEGDASGVRSFPARIAAACFDLEVVVPDRGEAGVGGTDEPEPAERTPAGPLNPPIKDLVKFAQCL